MIKENSIRYSNIELLRILSMSLIFLNHLSNHGGLFEKTNGINHYISCLMVCGGKFGVAIFVLIGSYFMIGRELHFKNIISLWIKTFIISLLGGIVVFSQNGSFKDLVKSFIPLYSAILWFVPAYIALMLISPFLNALISHITKDKLKLLIIILLVFLSIVPTLKLGSDIFMGSGNLIWFIFLYFISAYIKLYIDKKYAYKKSFLLLLISIITYLSMFLILVVYGDKYVFIRSNGSIVMLISAVSLFIVFIYRIKPFHNKVVNIIAKGTFMLYLLHDNSARMIIWNDVCKINMFYDSNYLVPYSLFLLICFFCIAIILDLLFGIICKYILKNRFVIKCVDYLDKLLNI